MMSLQVISEDLELINEIADFLLSESLIANALISEEMRYKTRSGSTNASVTVFSLKGISKSLLFGRISHKLRERYGDGTPLFFSEPIISIDPSHRELLIRDLAKV